MKKLKLKDELKLVASAERDRIDGILADKLEKDLDKAKQIGYILKIVKQDFARAYPGQTRTSVIPNYVLRKNDRHEIARLNELLGLEGS